MINDFELTKQYQRSCQYAYEKEKEAYRQEWSFVKNLICKAYNIDEVTNANNNVDNDNFNATLINNNIKDEKVKELAHEIRKNRNTYEHGNIDSLNAPNIVDVSNELDEIINYINNNNSNNFQFVGKYRKIQIKKDEYDDALLTNDEFDKNNYSYTIYNNAYKRENSYFYINKFVNECKNPIFAVIHNILIRSDNIKPNPLILNENLSLFEKGEVYKFQIAMLTMLAKNDNENFKIIVSSSKEEIAKIALKNIMYYYEIIFRMTRLENKNKIQIIPSTNINENTIDVNGEKVEIAELSEFQYDTMIDNSHILLSNIDLKYEITDLNIQYYNILAKEIFEINELRQGQIETLKEFFKSSRPIMSILPTGYGKSLIYQFIALIYPKIMWIVSPNEFLVNDQISNLNDKNIYRVSYIKDISTVNPRIHIDEDKVPIFKSNINYIIAEGIVSDKIVRLLKCLSDGNYLSAISIDECHKTSIWGHQFSSQYATLIKQLISEFSECKFLLLSATVATRVQKEIKAQIPKLKVLQPCPLKRDNIVYDIKRLNNIKSIVDYIEKRYNESSELSGEISDLSIVVNNDEKILSEIMNQLKKRDGLSNRCFLFDGTMESYENFKIAYRAILFVTDDYLTGININNLNNLFIIGMPINKEWFYQQSGRVGRYLKDGFVSVLLLNEDNTIINNIVNNKLEQIDENETKKWINHTNLTELTNPSFRYDDEIIKKCVRNFR